MIRGPELSHLNASADPDGLSVKYILVRIWKKWNETIFQYVC